MHKKTETNPKGAGRKPLHDAPGNAVTKHFRIKLTPLEYKKVCKEAAKESRTPTAHVRHLILESIKPKPRNLD